MPPTLIQSRRGFLSSLGAALFCAPAIVRAGSLMPVRAVKWPTIYANPEIRVGMEVIRDRNILLLTMKDYSGLPEYSCLWRSIPILVVDSLLDDIPTRHA